MKKTVLRVQEFEDRLVPSASIDSSYEAYSWVLINNLRANPAAFANNIQGLINGTVSSAFGFRSGDPVVADLRGMVNAATHPGNYVASLALMRSTPPAGPLAWDELLEYRAHAHNDWMRANGFAHTGSTGRRTAIPGYSPNAAAPTDTWGYGDPTYTSWGEDIAWAVGSLRATKAAYNTGAVSLAGLEQREAFLDTAAYMLELNSPNLGHLHNLLGRDNGVGGSLPAYNAIGIDEDLYQAPAGYEAQDGVPESWVSTHRLALSRPNGSGGYVVGVAFRDNNGNGFYDAGEALDATVNIRDSAGNGTTVNTDGQGAFSEYVPNGTYTVSFSSDGRWLGDRTVHINNSNDWADLIEGRPTKPPPAPAPSPPPSPAPPPRSLLAAMTRANLAQPSLTGPGGTLGYLRPTFTWTGVTGATAYQLRVDDLTTGQTDLFPGVTVAKQDWTAGADLVSGHAYRVAVRAMQWAAPGPWSESSDFTVGQPALAGPASGGDQLRPTFTWAPIGGATAYEVRVNDVTGDVPGLYVRRVSGTAWAPPGDLVSGRTYTWQVRALNGNGAGAWSDPVTVTLGRPTLTGPGGDAGTRRPTLTWTGMNWAPAYQVRVDDLTTGQRRVYKATTGRLDWTPPTDMAAGHVYLYYARALNSAGQGRWSDPQAFRVM